MENASKIRKMGDLTVDDFSNLLEEFYAPPQKRSKMTREEVVTLAQRLNTMIDVPLVRESQEEKIIIKVVLKVDGFLYDNLPNEIYDLVRSLDDGIDDKEAIRLVKRLALLANEKIDIPYLPESMEYLAIRFVIGVIINAARKQWNFSKASEQLDKNMIPDNHDADERALSTIILAV